MDIESCYQLGYVVRKHGLNGELYLHLDVDDPDVYRELESVFVAVDGDAMLVPFFIERISVDDKKVIAKFEGIDSPDEADRLVSCELYLPLEALPPLEDDQFYFHEIIDYTVTDKTAGPIGKVRFVYPSSAQDLLSVMVQGKEALIPINDDIITKVDKKNKNITVDLPDGLLDIYLND